MRPILLLVHWSPCPVLHRVTNLQDKLSHKDKRFFLLPNTAVWRDGLLEHWIMTRFFVWFIKLFDFDLTPAIFSPPPPSAWTNEKGRAYVTRDLLPKWGIGFASGMWHSDYYIGPTSSPCVFLVPWLSKKCVWSGVNRSCTKSWLDSGTFKSKNPLTLRHWDLDYRERK